MLVDLKFACRQLAKAPGFALVVILSLALGIGANTTVFCWIQGIVLRPLPGVADQGRLVALTTVSDRHMYDDVAVRYLREFQKQADVFSGIIGSAETPGLLTLGRNSHWLYGQITTANFFDVLGVRPILGRTFLPGEDLRPGGSPIMVLSELSWRRDFGADPAIVGRTIELNLHPVTIIGIVPKGFAGSMSGLRLDFWTPVDGLGNPWLHAQGRLKAGVSISAAQAEADIIGGRLERDDPRSNRNLRLKVLTMAHAPYGAASLLGRALIVLLTVSASVLLIVVANVANLLLARAMVRRKEIALRLALGSDRRKLMRLLLAESLLLSVAGGFAGAAFASWGIGAINAWTPPTELPLLIPVHADALTLGFTIILTLLVCFVFGFAPAWQASGMDPIAGLKAGAGASGAGPGRTRLRSILVVAEFALATIVVVGAGLCVASYARSKRAYLGFNPQNVLIVGLRSGLNGYTETTARGFYTRLEEKLTILPGIQATALCDWFPLGFEGTGFHSVTVDGYEKNDGHPTAIMMTATSPGYFSVMKTPLISGRDFTDKDAGTTPPVAIINEAMARHFWPDGNALGRKFREWGREITVVGIVPTGKYRFINEPPTEFYYLPYRQAESLDMNVCLRSAKDPAMVSIEVQHAIHEIDPRMEIWVTLRMTDYIKAAYLAPLVAARILSWLAMVALVLAGIGVYGLMAYTVNERTSEIGLRMALGAQRGQILRWILLQGSRLALFGLVAGIVAAIGMGRLAEALLYDTRIDDPLIYLGTAAILSGIALIACLIPAWKATRVDPLMAIRAE